MYGYNQQNYANAFQPNYMPQFTPTYQSNYGNNSAMPRLSGRVVNRIEDINISEIPTNGECAIFPSTDYGCIYVKKWLPNGSITTSVYMPQNEVKNAEVDNLPPTENKSEYEAILTRLEGIEQDIRRLTDEYIKPNADTTGE